MTFVLLVVLVNVIGRAVSKAIDALNLSIFNRLGGLLFGVLKGVLLCSVMVMVLNNLQLLGVVKPEVKEESKLYPYVELTVPYVYRGFDLVRDYAKEIMPEKEEKPAENGTVTSC